MPSPYFIFLCYVFDSSFLSVFFIVLDFWQVLTYGIWLEIKKMENFCMDFDQYLRAGLSKQTQNSILILGLLTQPIYVFKSLTSSNIKACELCGKINWDSFAQMPAVG